MSTRRTPGDPLRDFHRVDLLWTALVIAVAVGAIVGDHVSAAAAAEASAAGALRTAAATSAERLRLLVGPIVALLATTQKSLAFIPWPWDLDTWVQVARPIVDASPQISAYVLTEMVSAGNRSAWEARASATYGRPEHVLEFGRTGAHARAGAARGARRARGRGAITLAASGRHDR